MTTKQLNARALKTELKANGINTKKISAREKQGGYSTSFNVRLKSFDYTPDQIKTILSKFIKIDRCERTGEILAGGNTYIDVAYDWDFKQEQQKLFKSEAHLLIKELLNNEGSTIEKLGKKFCIPCGQPYPQCVYMDDRRLRVDGVERISLELAQLSHKQGLTPTAEQVESFKNLTYQQVMEMAKKYIAKDNKVKVTCPDDTAEYLYPLLAPLEVEKFFTLILDTKNKIVDLVEVTSGLIDRSHAHAREVFREAIKQNAHKIIIAHNHPTGSPFPSKQDLTTTQKLVKAGEVIGIQVVDHVIIGKGILQHRQGFYSMASSGEL